MAELGRASASHPGIGTLTASAQVSRGAAAAYAALFLLAAFLCLWQLDARRLWGDEAETAVLAVNVVRFGLPITLDERNEITNLPNRQDANAEHVWIWSPWLDEYIAAASIRVLGPTTLAARLPFALIGLATLAMLGLVARRIYRGNQVALIAIALTVTCVPFLLHTRQARYYAVLAFAATWILYGLTATLENRRRAGAIHLALGLTTLFYCNYITALGFSVGLGVLAVSKLRTERAVTLTIACGGLGFGALALPWILYADAGSQLGLVDATRLGPNLLYYASEIHFHLVPWVLLAIPLLALVWRTLRGRLQHDPPSRAIRTFETACWLLLGGSLLIDALSPLRFFRYLTPLIPVLMLLAGSILVRYVKPPPLRWLVVAALALSNAFAIASGVIFPSRPGHTLELTTWNFFNSITAEHRERVDGVLAYLQAEAQPGDRVWVPDPEFPLIFYTDLRILDARLQRGVPTEEPAWILPVSASGISTRRQLKLPPALEGRYEEIRLRVPNSPRGGNRPDPHAHSLGPNEQMEDFRIYRNHKVRPTAETP
jgi:hypothetical protein